MKTRHICRILLLVALALGWTATPSMAQRVALVIGNGAYQHVPVLPNPTNDAADLAAAFTRLGFSVRRVENATYDQMRRALLAFSHDARGAEMAVVAYTGHGMEVGGENWLIPIDAELRSDADAEQEAIGLKSVMSTVDGATKLGLVILDACRNNPFLAKMTRSVRTRAVSRGLVGVEPQGNVLVAYAARDGTTAADGAGRNSPFTAALLRNLETPGLEINFLFRNVRDDVMTATKREQQPFVYGSLSREAIYLKPGSAVAAVTPPVVSPVQPAAPAPVTIPPGVAPAPVVIPQAPAATTQPAPLDRELKIEERKFPDKIRHASVRSAEIFSAKGRCFVSEQVALPEGRVFFYVTDYVASSDRKVFGEISLIFEKVKVADASIVSGGRKFELFIRDDGGWIKNLAEEKDLVQSINSGALTEILVTPKRGAAFRRELDTRAFQTALSHKSRFCRI